MLGEEGLAWQARVVSADTQRVSGGSFATALEQGREAVEACARLGDALEEARAHRFVGTTLSDLGRNAESIAEAQRGAEAARRAGDAVLEGRCQIGGVASMMFGPTEAGESVRWAHEALARLRDQPRAHALVTIYASLGYAMLERFDEARSMCRLGQDTLQDLGAVSAAGAAQFSGWIELWADDPAAAERVLRPADEELEGKGERYFRSSLVALVAEALARQDGSPRRSPTRPPAASSPIRTTSSRRCPGGLRLRSVSLRGTHRRGGGHRSRGSHDRGRDRRPEYARSRTAPTRRGGRARLPWRRGTGIGGGSDRGVRAQGQSRCAPTGLEAARGVRAAAGPGLAVRYEPAIALAVPGYSRAPPGLRYSASSSPAMAGSAPTSSRNGSRSSTNRRASVTASTVAVRVPEVSSYCARTEHAPLRRALGDAELAGLDEVERSAGSPSGTTTSRARTLRARSR